MLWVNTPLVMASPEYVLSVRYVSIVHKVRNPMGMHRHTLPHELGILMDNLTV